MLLSRIDINNQVGIEIGALAKPIISKSDGTIYYADHLSTQDLRKKYADHSKLGLVDLDAIVNVDFVLADCSLIEALGDKGPVDYVVASHVIEHLPDTIGWLQQIAKCLHEGGYLCLAIPDKRFTFDHFRECSTTRELIANYLQHVVLPTPAQVFDHVAHAAEVDAAAVWQGNTRKRRPIDEGHTLDNGLLLARDLMERPVFHDVHCTVFTPYSFCCLLKDLMSLNLVPYTVAEFATTQHMGTEFHVTLRKETETSPEIRTATVPDLHFSKDHLLPMVTENCEYMQSQINQIQSLMTTVGERDREIAILHDINAELSASMQHKVDALNRQNEVLQSLYASTSWKVSSPVRLVGRLLRSLLRNSKLTQTGRVP